MAIDILSQYLQSSQNEEDECKRLEARMQGHVLGLWNTQRDWIELLRYKR